MARHLLPRRCRLHASRASIELDETRIALDILLARAWWINEETDRGRRLTEEALAKAEAVGWTDRRLGGLLRDLAEIAAADGKDALAREYRTRAERCPVPCAEDVVVALMAEVDNDAVVVDQGRFVEARLDFIGSAYGRQSDAYIDMLGTSSIALQDHRPWLAMDFRQRQIEALLDRGEAPEALLSERLAMADLLLEAGKYARLAAYTDSMVSDLARLSAKQLPEKVWLMSAIHRIRARGRRQMNAADTRQTYEEALDVLFTHGSRERAEILVLDLLDTSYMDLARRLAQAMHKEGDRNTGAALARIAAREEQLQEAADLTQSSIDALRRQSTNTDNSAGETSEGTLLLSALSIQKAVYLETMGKTEEAEAIRNALPPLSGSVTESGIDWYRIHELRDNGTYDAAAYLAGDMLDEAREIQQRSTYRDAQRLWQLAYTFARAGNQEQAFPLMLRAAEIASGHSSRSSDKIESSDGGSLELLRRDKWRYLLFVDIAWGAVSGQTPQDMTVLSRY